MNEYTFYLQYDKTEGAITVLLSPSSLVHDYRPYKGFYAHACQLNVQVPRFASIEHNLLANALMLYLDENMLVRPSELTYVKDCGCKGRKKAKIDIEGRKQSKLFDE